MMDSATGATSAPSIFAPMLAEARAAALAWRASTGRKIVGFIGADVPVEIIAAAGLLPFRVGVFGSTVTAVERFLEMGDSDVVAQLANALLDGSHDFLDHLVIGNTPTFNITLFHFLRESRRLDPRFPAPPMTFHETHHGEGKTIESFNRESCRRLADRLGELGSPVTETALNVAIERTNARRREFARLGALRRQQPSAITGTDMLALLARWQMLPQALLPEPPQQIRHLPRVLFSGSDLGHFRHYPLIEATGCTIVADDHDWGEDAVTSLVATGGDALSAIAARYTRQAPRAARWPRRRRIESLLERAVDADADGVVFWISDEDQASSWDLPALIDALNARDIATLDLGPQPAIGVDELAIAAKLRHWLYTLHTERRTKVAR